MNGGSERRPGAALDDEARDAYVALWLLKKLDLKPADGGMELPVALPAELSPLDGRPVLQTLDGTVRAFGIDRATYRPGARAEDALGRVIGCLLYTSPSPRD